MLTTSFARGVNCALWLAVAAVAAFAQAPWVLDLQTGNGLASPPTATRSGLVIVKGSNLGSEGELRIDDLKAPLVSWTPTEVVGYVPETAGTGTVGVQVVTSEASSNIAFLNVVDRQASGHLLWRFRMDAPYSRVRPARAADGTIYVVDVYGRLYALTPNGALKWLVRDAGNKGLALAPDGTIYTGSENDVKAFEPDGTLKWSFVQNPRAFILIGLTADKAGNVYGVASNGMGAFSLDPAGHERWRTAEAYNRPIVDYSELAIGPNGGFEQLYWYGNAHTRAVRTSDGSSVFTIAGGQPVVSPFDGSVHIANSSFSPNGQLLWSHYTGYGNSVPDVGSDGTHYYVSRTSDLYALGTSGFVTWSLTLPKYVGGPDVDPTNTVLLLGGSNTLDIPGFLQGVGVGSRKVEWEVPLPAEETAVFNNATGQYGFNQFQDTRARFTPDGRVAYVGTAIAPGAAPVRDRCFLNAIDSSTGSAQPPVKFKLRIESVRLTGSTQGNVLVTAAIRVIDTAGVPVPYATVSGTWKMPRGGALKPSATTDANGMVYFTAGSSRGTYTFTVTNVVKSGYTFDAAGSVLKQSITI